MRPSVRDLRGLALRLGSEAQTYISAHTHHSASHAHISHIRTHILKTGRTHTYQRIRGDRTTDATIGLGLPTPPLFFLVRSSVCTAVCAAEFPLAVFSSKQNNKKVYLQTNVFLYPRGRLYDIYMIYLPIYL